MIIFIAMIKNINAQPVTNLVYDIGVYVITTTEKEMEPHFTAVEISNLRLVKTFQLLAIVKEIGAIKVSHREWIIESSSLVFTRYLDCPFTLVSCFVIFSLFFIDLGCIREIMDKRRLIYLVIMQL